MKKFSLSLLLLATIESGSQAAEPVTAAPSAKPLAPFTYDLQQESRDLRNMRAEPVCKDFLAYLNDPRSNEIFKRDGTLVRENERFNSINWDTLDKKQYGDGFMSIADTSHPNVRVEYLTRFSDPQWILQRAVAHPHERPTKKKPLERWLYRLVISRPYTRVLENPASKVELPIWFHYNSVQWLGDVLGKGLTNDVHELLGRAGAPQWIVYLGGTYAVTNSTYGDGKGALPEFLKLDVHELNVNGEGHSFLHWMCAFRARNKE